MTESRNPFESPRAPTGLTPIDKPAIPETDVNMKGMLWLIGVTVFIVAMECLFTGDLGPVLLLGPPILFFVIAVWSVIAGTRHGSKPMWVRIVLGLLVGILAVPSFQFLLMVTCIPAIDVVGAGWSPKSGMGTRRVPFTIVSSLLVAVFALLLFGLAYLTPKSLKSKPQSPRNDSQPGG